MTPEARVTGAVAAVRSRLARRDGPAGTGPLVSVDALSDQRHLHDLELVSFDVFDTLIVRDEPAPGAIDLLVGAKLERDGVDSVAYAIARRDAATRAADDAAGRAPGLGAIISRVGETLGWTQDLVDTTVCMEQLTEIDHLSAVPGAADLLDTLRDRGVRIALVSDMHLGSDVLGPFLTDRGLLGSDDLLLVSCDLGASKAADGELFARLITRGDCTADRILHVGNDPWADHAMARRRGIRTKLVRSGELSRFEQAMVSPQLADRRDLGSIVAGAARQARLDALAHGEPPALASVVAGVAAPAMIGFTTWVARRADDLGLDRLVFLSRNGRLAYEVYRRLPRIITSDRPSAYLHLSRDAVRLASAADDVDAWIDCGHDTSSSFLRQHIQLLPVSDFLARLRLPTAAVGPVFEDRGFVLGRPVPTDRSAEDWRACFDDPRFRAALAERAQADRSLLVDYLDQNGLTASERIGVVDIGWRGQQAAMMSAVAESASDVQLHHLHFGQNASEQLLRPTHIERYLFDHGDPPVVDNPVGLFETLTATSEPGMIGLRRGDDGVEPLFRITPDPVRESDHVAPLHRIVAEVADLTAQRLESRHRTDDLRDRIIAAARAFWSEPTRDEARYWTALPFERDASGRAVTTLGAPIRADDLGAIVTGKGWDGRQWLRGSVAVSHSVTGRAISAARRLRSRS